MICHHRLCRVGLERLVLLLLLLLLLLCICSSMSFYTPRVFLRRWLSFFFSAAAVALF
jgi:hypothetical protein